MVNSCRETPGPIPNPEAKPAHADGTATGRLWESKSPPTPNNKNTTKYNHDEAVGLHVRVALRLLSSFYKPNTSIRQQFQSLSGCGGEPFEVVTHRVSVGLLAGNCQAMLPSAGSPTTRGPRGCPCSRGLFQLSFCQHTASSEAANPTEKLVIRIWAYCACATENR